MNSGFASTTETFDDEFIPGLGLSQDECDALMDEFSPVHFGNGVAKNENDMPDTDFVREMDRLSEICWKECADFEKSEEQLLEHEAQQFFKLESAPPRHTKKRKYRNRRF